MKQIVPLGDKRVLAGCIYCGADDADSRDHVPSRVLLDERFPDPDLADPWEIHHLRPRPHPACFVASSREGRKNSGRTGDREQKFRLQATKTEVRQWNRRLEAVWLTEYPEANSLHFLILFASVFRRKENRGRLRGDLF